MHGSGVRRIGGRHARPRTTVSRWPQFDPTVRAAAPFGLQFFIEAFGEIAERARRLTQLRVLLFELSHLFVTIAKFVLHSPITPLAHLMPGYARAGPSFSVSRNLSLAGLVKAGEDIPHNVV